MLEMLCKIRTQDMDLAVFSSWNLGPPDEFERS